jgi:two-component system, LytTR family, response regulator LytT
LDLQNSSAEINMNFCFALVDDEPEFLESLDSFLHKYAQERGFSIETKKYTNGYDFLEELNGTIDVVFLDIRMPLIDGLEVAQKIRLKDKNTGIVFITNMANLAVKGYMVNAIDFILKPINYSKFSFKMEKIIKYVLCNKQSLTFKTKEGKIERILFTDIVCIEVFRHDLICHTVSKDYSGTGTLKALTEELGKYGFCQCNKCFLINCRHVSQVKGNIVVTDKGEFAISRPKKSSFVNYFVNFIGGINS